MTRQAVICAASAILLGAVFMTLALWYDHPLVVGFDEVVADAVTSVRSDGLTVAMRAMSVSAGTVVVLAVTVLIAIKLYRAGARIVAGTVLAIVAGGTALSSLFKIVVDRPRPPLSNMLIAPPADASLPSGHTMASLCVAVTAVCAISAVGVTRWRSVAIVGAVMLWAVLVGASRVYLGVHWPSDVVAAWLLGGAWIGVVLAVTGGCETR